MEVAIVASPARGQKKGFTMKKQISNPISRRGFVAGGTALAGALGFPAILRAQAAPVKVGMIHPVTGFVAYNGQQSRLGGTMAVEDVNKAGGIKSMGGAKLEALLGDSQSKVEVGVAEVEKMNEAGRRGLYRLLPEPGRHRRQPGGREVQHAVPDRRRRLRPDRQSRAEERVPAEAGLRRLRRRRRRQSRRPQQGGGQPGEDRGDRPRNRASSAPARPSCWQGKLPSVGIEAKELIAHDNPTRNFDNIALRIRSIAPDIVMMSNYQNEYVLLARTLYQQKVNLAGFYLDPRRRLQLQVRQGDARRLAVHDGREPLVQSQEEKAQALKKRVEATGALFTFEVYLTYTNVMLLADALERAGSADKAKLTEALANSTFKAELMPYGPTKFVNGQNQGGRPGVMQALKGDIEVIAPAEFASAKAVFPKPKF